jgi:hypothetical protein
LEVLLAGALVAGCTGGSRSASESVAAAESALSGTRQITLQLPQGTALHTLGLLAAGTLHIADGVTVKAATPAAPVAVANSGVGLTDLGVQTITGDVVSQGPVTLHDRAQVAGSVTTASTITPGNGVVVSGTERQHATLTPLQSFSWSVTLPAATGGPVDLEPGQTRSLTPGSYTTGSIKAGATLHLAAGTYAFDTFSLEPQGTVSVDASGGPVFIYVGAQLDLKGALDAGAHPASLMIVYLGTAQGSLEAPFTGTVVAPNAKLYLAPVGAPGFVGSFFAAQIDVEAHDTVTLQPFAGWDLLFPPVPIVECVTRFDATHANALFGYQSSLDVAATIPVGARNQLAPSPAPPPEVTTFLPGQHDDVFFAAFSGASLAWTLSGQTVTAGAGTRPCTLADYQGPAMGTPTTPPEGASQAGPAVRAGIIPDQPRGLRFQSAPLPWGSSGGAAAAQAASVQDPLKAADAPLTSQDVPQTFELIIDGQTLGSDAICGPNQLEMTSVSIAGITFGARDLPGCTNPFACGVPIPDEHYTVILPAGQSDVPIHMVVDEVDTPLCGGANDPEFVIDLDVDNNTGSVGGGYNTFDPDGSAFLSPGQCIKSQDGSTRCSIQGGGDGYGIAWTIRPGGKPRICAQWNAQYIDAGFGEDFATATGVQQLPASFAMATFSVSNGSASTSYTGPLDQDGCVPSAQSPSLQQLVVGTAGAPFLSMRMDLSTQFCLDPTGAACAGAGPAAPGGARFSVTRAGASGPATICTILTEDETLQDPDCAVITPSQGAFSQWFNQGTFSTPPDTVNIAGVTHADVTRIGGTVSQLLRREVITNGEMGIELALISSAASNPTAVSNPGEIDIVSNSICPEINDTCAGDPIHYRGEAGCQDGEASANCFSGDDRWKITIAHEIGHVIQRRSMGWWNALYTFDTPSGTQNDPVGAPPLCRCDQVDIANQLHCLQSLERSSAAQTEGFAQYYASKTWNDDTQTDCEFTYYKQFLSPQCLPGVPAADCAADPNNPGLFINSPPLPTDCFNPTRWRNSHCLTNPAPAGSVLPDMGVEYDWMGFYYQLSRPGPNSLTPANLALLYRVTCNQPTGYCATDELAWEDCPTCVPAAKGIHPALAAQQASGNISLELLQNFEALGNLYGVSRDTTPNP